MPAINFKPQFADLVESGRKRQTIRAMRKRPFEVGDRLIFFVGLRTKASRKLGEAICTKVESIEIKMIVDEYVEFWVDGYRLSRGLVEDLAIADGFGDNLIPGASLFLYFRDRLPFVGQVVHW